MLKVDEDLSSVIYSVLCRCAVDVDIIPSKLRLLTNTSYTTLIAFEILELKPIPRRSSIERERYLEAI
ncbi:MAG TPA: hypothetical protein DCP67_06110 [Planctomycetaceae bacterium]|nr:hypothetical protein [Planctomycetaceae bacterium]HCK72390.1 hypothetical protein [Planctomycetaceae bacterium]HCP85030.1 hypothetical protein [Planctomycetaceae bacterium]